MASIKGLGERLRAMMDLPRDDPRLLRAQYTALGRQLPMMYFILVVNTWVLVATHIHLAPAALTLAMPTVLTAVSIWRTLYWWRRRGIVPDDREVHGALMRTGVLSIPVAVGFTAWALSLYPYGDDYARVHVAFFMAITVIGCIFSMMHLRRAALITTAVVDTAFVFFFINTGVPVLVACAVNILLVSIAMLVILHNHYTTFTRLVAEQARSEQLSDENLRLAHEDSLTGLPNRRQFFIALEQALARARLEGTRLAVGILDLDGFKPINDLYGHSVGDRLLVQVGERLSTLVDRRTRVARLGGDEFALIIEQVESDAQLLAFGQLICQVLAVPITLTDVPVQIGASLGVATFPDRATDAEQAFEFADYALYQSKRSQRGQVSVFSEQHQSQLQRDILTEQALRRADLDAELAVVFQPIIALDGRGTVAFEALARWHSPHLGFVPPGQFIAVAERIGMINQLTVPLLRKALATASQWPAEVRLSFNLSARDCGSPKAAQVLIDVIRASGFDPVRLDLEITETAVMQDLQQVQAVIAMFRGMGCGISLDDFGTGYSSLSQLHALALTKLKVDRSFVSDMHINPASFKIVKSLLALSADMQLDCIVEGVESAQELSALESLGAKLVQGYYFAKPMPAQQTLEWLETPICAIQ
ncbi:MULTISPECIES: bifunctional diguanylate cyclase/phosphodiesterase [unclassified Pseudomonas]|uniref:putative bifunctional diguanylate cyclase/phosphodiesterase n=1 Tax=unclassified Pseudomonas TaxID=196821 RepID=UPI000BD8CA56|nr:MULTISPECIES: EAL domain-containing protein [unclassified Pseudomonas]PVZ19607.1 diguanylate cyclase (GGDEF)-like protein [Pseudomonas sp. URIL14HWK12:I12]PVZ22808.1 diguanylate cyclase (GGDEF)-like protein [Pseudomonas sp. URIL14HWK12:I10]PVZ37562.1 diguanylate cyclase (GGDEF)-like protein [Pseudomonas sp. URIL14HWK12:I11]SNZ15114.1 diguanylate cyclase (GGDEF) domain-containing protein [Pseudomonas sp. URIL14HWK12:I9]